MTSGAYFRNASNELLISNAVKSLHFRETIPAGSANLAYSTTIYGGYAIWTYIVTCPVFPIVFFEVSNYPTSIARIFSIAANTWKVEVITGGIPSGSYSALIPTVSKKL